MGWSALETMPKRTGSACATVDQLDDFAGGGCGHIAEEEIGDVALEDDDFAVAGEDAREHADGALQDGDDGEHGGDAEGDSGDADEGADAVAAEIGEDQLEKDHDRSLVTASSAISQALSVTWRSSPSRSLRSFERNDKAGPVNEQPVKREVADAHKTFEALDGAADANGTGDIGAIEEFVAGGGLAGFIGALENVLEVVDDLIAEAPADGDALEQLDLAGGSAAKHRRNNEGETDERNGLAARDALGGFAGVGQRGVVKVEALAVQQAFNAEALFDVGHHVTTAALRAEAATARQMRA